MADLPTSPSLLPEEIAAAQAAATPTPAPGPMAPSQPVAAGPVNVVNPEGELVSIPGEQLEEALSSGYTQPTPEAIHEATQQSKYGSTGQTLMAGAEAIGRGVAGPVFTGVQRAFGVEPEDIRGREEANPTLAGIAEAGSFVGSMFTGVGEATLLAKAGEAAAATAKISKATRIGRMSNEAIKGAFEAGLYQGGEEIHKRFVEDPNQSAESAISNIGMATVMGGVFGGGVGAVLGKQKAVTEAERLVSGLDIPALEAGDIKMAVQHSESIPEAKKKGILGAFDLGKQKANSKEITAAAKELGAEVLPGATSDDKLVQYGVDTLLNSPATYSGRRVIDRFDRAYNQAESVLDNSISSSSKASKAELGESVRESLTKKIQAEYAPIKESYGELAEIHKVVPIEEDAAALLAKQLSDIPEFRVAPSSAEGQLVGQVFKDIKNAKTLSDLKILKDTLSLPATASSGEKRMVGILRDKLTDIEEDMVERYAKSIPRNDEAGAYIHSLIDKKRALTPEYRKYISKIGELSEQLGKGKVHGTQDALNFLNEKLTSEQVATRLFAKNDSAFMKFFQKNFPEEFMAVRDYQRAAMKEAAMTGDTFSPKRFFNAFNKLEPEIQKTLYTQAEIKKIAAAETYMREAFPKNFNPSGTSHVENFRESLLNPAKWAAANVRDYTIEQLVARAQTSAQGQQAMALAQATVKGERLATKAIKDIFTGVKGKDLPAALIPLAASRQALDKAVTKAIINPTSLVAMNDNNDAVPEYSQAFAASAARVVNYLASIKPDTQPKMALDSKRPANAVDTAAYNRALDIAQQPMVVLSHLGQGRLTPNDVIAMRTMYPSLYQTLSQKLTGAIADTVAAGKVVPYQTRLGLALFLGQPVDSTMTPEAIQAIQAAGNATAAKRDMEAQGRQGSPPPASSVKGLNGLSKGAQTPTQAREASKQTGSH